jgi:response regulator of citrate/malate metabolism
MEILIVEDDEIATRVLEGCIQPIEYISNIDTAKSLDEALQKIKTDQPGIIFLDLSIHEKNDGFEVLKLVQSRFPYLKVAIVSSDTNLSTVRETLSLGAIAYLKKPFSPKQIEKIISKLGQKQ